jgi:hypothetical protein
MVAADCRHERTSPERRPSSTILVWLDQAAYGIRVRQAPGDPTARRPGRDYSRISTRIPFLQSRAAPPRTAAANPPLRARRFDPLRRRSAGGCVIRMRPVQEHTGAGVVKVPLLENTVHTQAWVRVVEPGEERQLVRLEGVMVTVGWSCPRADRPPRVGLEPDDQAGVG